jgi:hypothetical protein
MPNASDVGAVSISTYNSHTHSISNADHLMRTYGTPTAGGDELTGFTLVEITSTGTHQ